MMHVDIDQHVFYLNTLYETSRELNSLVQPRKILESFLLMSMGALGLAGGVAVLLDETAGQAEIVGRGIEPAGVRRLESGRARLIELCTASGRLPGAAPAVPHFADDRELEKIGDLLPPPINAAVIWRIDDRFAGLVAITATLEGESLDAYGAELLLNLTLVLTSALGHAIATQHVNSLNADLHAKNTALRQALEDAAAAREDLHKRLFHLKALNDLTAELSPLADSGKLMEAFLLMVMGGFSIHAGAILLIDRKTLQVQIVSRGVERLVRLDAAAADRLALQCLDTAEEKRLAPMSVMRLADCAPFREAGFGFDPWTARMFVIEPQLIGIIALGPPLSGMPLDAEENAVLDTGLSNLMIYIRTARDFQTINALNDDLTRRNRQLQETIAELRTAHQRIDFLENAKNHIKALVRGELRRTRAVRALDFVLIALAALMAGVLYNASSPNGIALIPESLFAAGPEQIEASTARALASGGAVWIVDARPKAFYDQKHIKGAVNLSPDLFDIVYPLKFGNLDRSTGLIVYGRTFSRHYDQTVALRLMQRDHERVLVLSGGLAAWEERGYAVEP